jgi:hypothetical protein
MEYTCEICNKNYKSYQSIWNHNHRYHKNNSIHISSDYTQQSSNSLKKSSNKLLNTQTPIQTNSLTCEFCKKIFSRSDNLKRHKIKCNKNQTDKFEEIKEEIKELKKEFQVEIKKLKTTKNGPTTNIKVNGNIIGTNTDNGPKQIIYKTGTEKMDQITYGEVSTIFDNEIFSVIKLIELVNFSENKPENHSFCSTALESPYLSYYNTDTNSVNKERKRYFFEEVICKSIQNHEILYKKFKSKFNSSKRKQIEDNISNLKKMKENSFSSKIMGEMIRNLNLISYNKRDLVQDTWSGKKYENESDEEFMAMLLNDPETQKIIESNKKDKLNNDSDNYVNSDSESEEERITLPSKFNKKNIIL